MFDRRTQLLIDFGYDGERFRGLQPQPDQPTAGAALRQRFEDATVTPKALCWAARTDAGVHALHNIATCWLRDCEPSCVAQVINAVEAARDDGLCDVRVRQVPIDVHARNIGLGKHYRYLIDDRFGDCRSDLYRSDLFPAQDGRSWCVAPTLNAAAMQWAAQALIGEHDFSSFRTRRCNATDPCRRVDQITVTVDAAATRGPGKRIIIDVRGQSFLRHMVRIIAGTLAEIGAGLRAPEAATEILAARSRAAAGITAPARGLCLVEVMTDAARLVSMPSSHR